MPGSIRVSVLDAFDLPKVVTEGEHVAVKVSMGMNEYTTASSKVIDGKTPPWNADFMFPVLNLRDNLFVVLLDEKGEIISKHEMGTPTIVEQGLFDVDLALDRGGKIKLQISFRLTDEERRRIDIMRAAALKRREESLKKTDDVSLDSKPLSVDEERETDTRIQALNPTSASEDRNAESAEDGQLMRQASNTVKDRVKVLESSAQAQVEGDVCVRKVLFDSHQHESLENGSFMDDNLSGNVVGCSGPLENGDDSLVREFIGDQVISKPESDTERDTTVEQSNPEGHKNVNIGETNNTLLGTFVQIFTGAAFVVAGVMIWTITKNKRLQHRRSAVRQRALMRKK